MTTSQPDVVRDLAAAAAKLAPPAAVLVLHLSDIFVFISTLYVIAQLSYLLWKWRREAKRGR